MQYTFIINPAAGGGRGRVAWERLVAELRRWDVRYQAVFTEAPGDAERFASERAHDSEVIVAVGGDGTLHEIGNGLFRKDALPPKGLKVGLVPAGTGNDYARTLGIPRSPREALAMLRSGPSRAVDIGRANDRCFLNVSGVGFDARVAHEVSRMRKYLRGSPAYVMAALRLLPRLQNPMLTLRADGMRLREPILLIAAGVCRYYGGGMMVCPHAREDDGMLDVCVAGDLGRIEALRALMAAFKGRHLQLPKFYYQSVSRLEVSGPRDVMVHADGQVIGNLPIRYELVPRSLNVIARPAARRGDELLFEGT